MTATSTPEPVSNDNERRFRAGDALHLLQLVAFVWKVRHGHLAPDDWLTVLESLLSLAPCTLAICSSTTRRRDRPGE